VCSTPFTRNMDSKEDILTKEIDSWKALSMRYEKKIGSSFIKLIHGKL